MVSIKPALSDALSFMMPAQRQSLLLRACLWSGESANQAFEAWQDHAGDPVSVLMQDDEGVKNLLPLLSVSLKDNGTIVDPQFQTCLRTAYLRDELRTKLYRDICRDVLRIFNTAEIPTIVIGGAALADTVYRDPVLQHAHYLELLVMQDTLHHALTSLRTIGFATSNASMVSGQGTFEIVHQSGLPLLLHKSLFDIPFYKVPVAALWTRSRTRTIADVPGRILSPSDSLLHSCGQPFCGPNPESLRWVCDSWFIIKQWPNLDWDCLLDCATRAHMALPLSVTLGYLAEGLHAPIPTHFLDRLCTAASRPDMVGREAALFGARANSRGGFKKLLMSAGSWHERALIVKWMLLPSLTYLRWIAQIRRPWLVPFYYVYRPLRYITRRFWSVCKPTMRSKWLQTKSMAVLLGSRG